MYKLECLIIVPQAEALEEILEPIGTMVVVEAKHSRGVKNTIAMTTTSAVRGIFAEKAEARAEFLTLIKD